MKKAVFLFSLVAGLFVANAQTASATLNVNLQPVQSITINAIPTVAINYATSTDYSGTGVEVTATDHLKVVSSGGFVVSVSAQDANLSGSNSAGAITETIAASGIKVVASNGTGNTGGTFTPQAALTVGTASTGAVLLSSDTGGATKLYTVKYQGAGGNAYLAKRIGTGTTTYTTQVQYSIVAN
ncbi:MAG: hypothetical protein K0M63_06350 [Weeksellaceae bacterium]|nr:hypothetical protein [Weeksellaceae bacterium]